MQRILFARVEIWLLLVLAVFATLGLIAFGGIVLDEANGGNRYGAVGATALKVAEVPGTVEHLLKVGNAMVVPLKNRFNDETGWRFADGKPGTGLPGYWLLSRHIAAERRMVTEMVRLSDGQVVHTWAPDADTLLATAGPAKRAGSTANWTNAKFRIFHPFLMENGDLILKDGGTPLLRVDACANPVWMLQDTLFHHSTESDGKGGFWIPSIIAPSKIPFVAETFLDDGLAHVSADGKLLEQISASEILMRHDMQSIVFPPFVQNDDPLHLNDIQPVLTDGPYWKAGDLFLSLRHPSIVMLYRPATDQIIWMKQGPWMAQHDVDILDDHRIAIFDNRTFYRASYGRPDGTSDIVVYDFSTDTVTHPYQAALEREKVAALFEGLYTILPGGDYIVEDQNTGRLLIFAADGKKLGQFINRNPDGQVYQIGWGRFVDQQYGDAVLTSLGTPDCTL